MINPFREQMMTEPAEKKVKTPLESLVDSVKKNSLALTVIKEFPDSKTEFPHSELLKRIARYDTGTPEDLHFRVGSAINFLIERDVLDYKMDLDIGYSYTLKPQGLEVSRACRSYKPTEQAAA